jgi:hypothetical protein
MGDESNEGLEHPPLLIARGAMDADRSRGPLWPRGTAPNVRVGDRPLPNARSAEREGDHELVEGTAGALPAFK